MLVYGFWVIRENQSKEAWQKGKGMVARTESWELTSGTAKGKQTAWTRSGWRILISKPPGSDVLSPANFHHLNLHKQCGIKCSNAQDDFSFKSPQVSYCQDSTGILKNIDVCKEWEDRKKVLGKWHKDRCSKYLWKYKESVGKYLLLSFFLIKFFPFWEFHTYV